MSRIDERLPEHAEPRSFHGPSPFVTRIEYDLDGTTYTWRSRWARKHPPGSIGGSTWWAPRALGWWIGVLFAIGSAAFALGAVPGYVDGVGGVADAVTFFVGSVFFTSAAALQYWETVRFEGPAPATRRLAWRRLVTPGPRRIDWWACAVQLVGTLFFNRSTAQAIATSLSPEAARHLVWRPDALGSICFLVASALAWFEVCHGYLAFEPKDLSWWITLGNLAGSIAFGVSAVASFVVSDGQLLDAELSNLGTFVGALCFLAASIALLPERTLAPPEVAAPTEVSDPGPR